MKNDKKDHIFGSHLNDPSPRYKGRIHLGGMDFQRSPTEGPDPAPGAKGKNVSSTRNLKNEN